MELPGHFNHDCIPDFLLCSKASLSLTVVEAHSSSKVHQVQTVQMREFPIVTRQTSETVYPKMAYSLTKSRMSVMNVALATSLTPIIVMVFFQISVRSLWDLNSAVRQLPKLTGRDF